MTSAERSTGPTLQSQPRARAKAAWIDAGLMLSALVLVGLLAWQAGRAGLGGTGAPDAAIAASAAMMDVAQQGEFTMLALASSGSADVVAVLDGRGERLFAYEIVNQREVRLLSNERLTDVFEACRRLGAGRP